MQQTKLRQHAESSPAPAVRRCLRGISSASAEAKASRADVEHRDLAPIFMHKHATCAQTNTHTDTDTEHWVPRADPRCLASSSRWITCSGHAWGGVGVHCSALKHLIAYLSALLLKTPQKEALGSACGSLNEMHSHRLHALQLRPHLLPHPAYLVTCTASGCERGPPWALRSGPARGTACILCEQGQH